MLHDGGADESDGQLSVDAVGASCDDIEPAGVDMEERSSRIDSKEMEEGFALAKSNEDEVADGADRQEDSEEDVGVDAIANSGPAGREGRPEGLPEVRGGRRQRGRCG